MSMSESYEVRCGDALEVLRGLPDAHVDALVTDPPAGIAFMGKEWDAAKGGRDQWVAWLTSIMRECLRVLKPGAHGLVWALPRTSHWTATALEDAGFEVREKVYFLFGTGFPKSLDVSKAIDRAAGAEREVVGVSPNWRESKRDREQYGSMEVRGENAGLLHGAPVTDAARRWAGFGTSLKPSAEEWVLVRKPLDGTVVENVLKHGTGALNIDASRISLAAEGEDSRLGGNGTWGTGKMAKNVYEGGYAGVRVGSSAQGRWPANVVLAHSEGCQQRGTKVVETGRGDVSVKASSVGYKGASLGKDSRKAGHRNITYRDGDGKEEVEAWECVSDCAVRMLDEQSGERTSGVPGTRRKPHETTAMSGRLGMLDRAEVGYADTGGASRFFKIFGGRECRFIYCAKPSTAEREAGLDHFPKKAGHDLVDREADSPGTKSPRAGAGRTAVLDSLTIVSYPPPAWVFAVLNQALPADTAQSLQKATAGSATQCSDDSVWSMCSCGSPTTDPFHRTIKSIIETERSWTTESRTWNSSPLLHTNGCMAAAFGAKAAGGNLASYAEFRSPSARRTGTSPSKDGRSTDDVAVATSLKSWLTEEPEGGGRRVQARANLHPT